MEPTPFKRKLAVILAADVVGYSRLMHADEEATVKTLSEYREIMNGFIVRHEGRVLDMVGDAALAEFGSAVEAVRCAIAIQEEITTRNVELPDDRKLRFRIGINVGDVLVKGDTLYGDGVNVAARLEALAEPGGICTSDNVFNQVKHKMSVSFEGMGPQEVKNISEPVDAFRIVPGPVSVAASAEAAPKSSAATKWRISAIAMAAIVVVLVAVWQFYPRGSEKVAETASKARMALPLPDKPSIALLPFTNMSGDPKQEYLADGITEAIITTLSQVPELFVIARTSSFAYKGKAMNVQQIARELGVRYILEGSFQRSGNRVRVTVQLIDAIKGNHLWSERYDREFKDIFTLEDDIALNVVSAMEVKLTEGEAARIRRRQTNNPEAYQLFLRGKEIFLRLTKMENVEARRLYEKVVSLDPKFAAGWTFLGWTYLMPVRLGWSADPAQDYARAEELGRKALAIDDSNAGAHHLLGQIFLNQRRYEQAIASAEKAVALQPSHALHTVFLGLNLVYVGRAEEGLELAKRAMRLSPLASALFLRILGLAYHSTGDHGEAITVLERARAQTPSAPFVYIYLAMTYSGAGREEEARAAVTELLRRQPMFSVKHAGNAILFKDPAKQKRALDALRKAGLPETSRSTAS